jgi:dinuclear metal center YbgI/SA1388 family protein
MKINEVTAFLEGIAPLCLQEDYDNAGLLAGNAAWDCRGILVCLDVTEEVVQEAVGKNCNLIVAHHPIIFGGLKKVTGRSYVERTIIAAIKNDIAIYAIHTNLDNLMAGVNGEMANRLGLLNRQVLLPKKQLLKKICVFVPADHAEAVRSAIFKAGGGHIGNYSECSFNSAGEGSFSAGEGASPFIGEIGKRHTAQEIKVEVLFQSWLEQAVVQQMLQAHPYEEVAFDILALENTFDAAGSGLLGYLPQPVPEREFLAMLKKAFGLSVIRHTCLQGKPVEKVALCGGAGSFLIKTALAAGADFYVTADVKYHEFFDAENRLVIADIGHYESEQYSISLVFDHLKQKCTTFAVLKTEINTNPVQYFL